MTTLLTRITRSLATAAAVFGLACALPAQATETIIYLHNDISGSPQAATDATGNLLWKESYTPYGERTVNSPSSSTGKGTNQLYFHGKKVEDLNGGVHLSYFGARYYDPSLGRFLQIDPQPFDPNNIHSFNRYAYGNNNPYKFTDPDGRNPAAVALLLHIGGGAITGAAAAGTISVIGQLYLNGSVQWGGLGGVFDAMGEGAQVGAIVGPAYAAYAGSARSIVAKGSVATKVDYSVIENPPNVGVGKDFTLRQKQQALELNRAANGGQVRSDQSGIVLTQPQKSQRGVTPSQNEWQIDHVVPKNCGGTNCSSNMQVLSRQENRAKSDN